MASSLTFPIPCTVSPPRFTYLTLSKAKVRNQGAPGNLYVFMEVSQPPGHTGAISIAASSQKSTGICELQTLKAAVLPRGAQAPSNFAATVLDRTDLTPEQTSRQHAHQSKGSDTTALISPAPLPSH